MKETTSLRSYEAVQRRLSLLTYLHRYGCDSVRKTIQNFNINSVFGTVLIRKDIIKKIHLPDKPHYVWNNNIDKPTYSMAETLFEKEKKYINDYKNNSTKRQIVVKETPAIDNNSSENIITINMNTGIISTHISNLVSMFDQIKRMGIKF